MSESPNYAQGGDAQAIRRIANDYYGGYAEMFAAHGWPERGNKLMPSVQARVVDTYGSVRAFEEAHKESDLMFPMEAIKSDPPNVWLTSFYGFKPEEWGFLGFADESRRQGFINGSKPGVLVVIYGAGEASKDELYKVIGVQQCSHKIGNAEQFMFPPAWDAKEKDPHRAGRWNYGVKATRAWRVTPETRMNVLDFAPEATKSKAWQHIGSRGVPLSQAEAANILKLDLQEVDVYGQNPIIGSLAGTAQEILAPSKAGPVSQNSFVTRESEGPKHLYILALQGDTDAFLGRPANGQIIVKAGFSKSPQTRCADHNKAIPKCAFRWEVLHSGPKYGINPYPSSDHAKSGERAMQKILCQKPKGCSLGGEFFLAESGLVQEAWDKGNHAAKVFKK
ncbi:GIY-YIG nuclease family protein [Paroceanicella profunda]|uniref:GIY-YIG nuclease family protein n=1 Tax=Paroceanicella profunda TaxID=2579971 RepID=A0A5B8FX50_9RHOB|nr:GIY-YIG nuclease family protein [Paroceanicella profunda]QDL91079.1 GIY-YIG nuclease family protein [Paroceanicella profunda]